MSLNGLAEVGFGEPIARHINVIICALVQVFAGEKVVADVPDNSQKKEGLQQLQPLRAKYSHLQKHSQNMLFLRFEDRFSKSSPCCRR